MAPLQPQERLRYSSCTVRGGFSAGSGSQRGFRVLVRVQGISAASGFKRGLRVQVRLQGKRAEVLNFGGLGFKALRFKGQGAGLGVWASGLQGAGFGFYGTGFRVNNVYEENTVPDKSGELATRWVTRAA